MKDIKKNRYQLIEKKKLDRLTKDISLAVVDARRE